MRTALIIMNSICALIYLGSLINALIIAPNNLRREGGNVRTWRSYYLLIALAVTACQVPRWILVGFGPFVYERVAGWLRLQP